MESSQIQKRNIALYVVLTIVTCGLFGLYWLCVVNNDTNLVSGHPEAFGGVAVILLTIITCGIYGFFWAYRMGQSIDEAKAKRGMPAGNTGMIYIILTLFGLGWVVSILLQSELNKLA